MMTSHDSIIIDSKKDHPFYEMARNHNVPSIQRGWARRLRGEALYGQNYLEDHIVRIKELYDIGVKDKSQKKSPSDMREIIRAENQDKFALPSESSIRQVVSQLAQKEKSGQFELSDVIQDIGEKDAAEGRIRGRKTWDKLEDKENTVLDDVINEDPEGKRSALYDEWERRVKNNNRKRLPRYVTRIPKKDILSRISTLKQKLQKQARYSVVFGPSK